MKHTHRIYTRLGFLLAAIGVILGAFGSHVLKELIGESELNTFDTGVRYQMIHALAIIILSLSHRKFDENKLDLTLGLFLAGILIFSGSLYLLATRSIWGDDSYRIIGAITPLGGIAFISGWLLMFFKGFLPEESKFDDSTSSTQSSSSRKHRKHRSSSSSLEDATK
ncbi:MAG: hypothetical protein CFE21_06940 [Bacteroidetes bacterium B1(2017)]|nr:MAG: hypothetical protein CFE21_06940 [Bacteroidetes bacterium B1(2017)]